MIELLVNGKHRQLHEPILLNKYLKSLGINLKSLAVAHNGTVLRRDEFDDVILSEGDRIEIVRAVGGG